jgi:adenine-specific DNA-methyltransferase
MSSPDFPATRYQGSKRKLAGAIGRELARLDFDRVLDAFGGTGAVAYRMKALGKQVTYNDLHRFNQLVGRALVENDGVTLSPEEADALTRRRRGQRYHDVVARCFDGVFFTAEENAWIDVVCQNIHRMTNRHRQAVAFWALFQACLVKRPFNLFHRANLAIRQRDVKRSFGNKATWDRPFRDHFLRFAEAANRAVFSNGRRHRATRHDALRYPRDDFDLVYIDTPYLSRRGVGVDYLDFYHFLEGLGTYPRWEPRIDRSRKHRPLRRRPDPWCDRRRIHSAFAALFARFPRSHLAISYRGDGIPGIDELCALLAATGRRPEVVPLGPYRYVLSTGRAAGEYLLLAPRPVQRRRGSQRGSTARSQKRSSSVAAGAAQANCR